MRTGRFVILLGLALGLSRGAGAQTRPCNVDETVLLLSPANGATSVAATPTLDWSDVLRRPSVRGQPL
jgi:hypothetical protein